MALAGRKERANPARRPWPAWMLGSEEKSSAKWRSCGRACCSSCAISRQQQRHSATGQKPARGAHFPCRMDWTFAAKRASVSANVDAGPDGPRIPPRWQCRHCGASAVAAHVPSQPKGSPHVAQQHSHKHRVDNTTEKNRKAQEAGPSLAAPQDEQERILALLRHPEGTTIAAFSLSPSSSDWVGALIRENR
jgi:hypothetical protein